MKIVALCGGLGNQMFQYAFYKALVKKHPTDDIYIDKTLYEYEKFRKYGLDHFNTNPVIAKNNQIEKFKKLRKCDKTGILTKLQRMLLKLFYKKFNTNLAGTYEPEILEFKDNIYYTGYFQTEKYFNDFRDEIISDFTLKNPVDEKNQIMAQQILNCNSVSLHIRRGDYLKYQDTLGLCELDYYYKALEIIAKKVENPVIFVFSDDFDWVKENFKIPFEMYLVDINNDETNYLDINLMNQCKHNIIANSTFSWWGAWLNTNPDKIVIAPKMWQKKTNYRFKDITPKSWMRI